MCATFSLLIIATAVAPTTTAIMSRILKKALLTLSLLPLVVSVYQPDLGISYLDIPPLWTHDVDRWREEFNVTIPPGGWDGHWTQYRPFVRDFIKLASMERPQCLSCRTPVRLPRQLTPIVYSRLYEYAVAYGLDVPPSLEGVSFETKVFDDGLITCVEMKSVNQFYYPSREITAICSPTVGPRQPVGETCHELWYSFWDLSNEGIDSLILFDFGSGDCYDILYAIGPKKLLVVNSNVRLRMASSKAFITFVNSKSTFLGPNDIYRLSVGLVHLTDNSEMTFQLFNERYVNFWKVVRVTDGSTFVAEQRRPSDSDKLRIESLLCDTSSSCSTRNVDVSYRATREFDYVQETYDYLNFYFETIDEPLYKYEFPREYSLIFKREPCPVGSTLTLLTRYNISRCVNPNRTHSGWFV